MTVETPGEVFCCWSKVQPGSKLNVLFRLSMQTFVCNSVYFQPLLLSVSSNHNVFPFSSGTALMGLFYPHNCRSPNVFSSVVFSLNPRDGSHLEMVVCKNFTEAVCEILRASRLAPTSTSHHLSSSFWRPVWTGASLLTTSTVHANTPSQESKVTLMDVVVWRKWRHFVLRVAPALIDTRPGPNCFSQA